MTLRELQEFLDAEKWKDSEIHACDMCGRYARCRYCVRTEQYPCAMAHNRLMTAIHAPVPDRIPDWLLPEPEILSETTQSVAENTPVQKSEAGKDERYASEEMHPVLAAVNEGKQSEAPKTSEPSSVPAVQTQVQTERPRVIVRGKGGDIRLCVLSRRIPTVSSELEK